MIPPARNVQDFTSVADALEAARGGARGGVEAEKPFGDAKGGGDFALIWRDVDAWRWGEGGGRGEHDPVL